jgi:hypothetical protein
MADRAAVFYPRSMRCAFHVDGDPTATWTEERHDLPLYVRDAVTHDGQAYEIIDGPHYEADWESATITSNLFVKPAPTSY